jgi:hypothetical protein
MNRERRVCGDDLLWKRKERRESGNEVLIGWLVEQPLSRLSGTLRLSPVLPLGGEIPRVIRHIQWFPFHRELGAQTQIVTAKTSDSGAEGAVHGISKRTGVARAQPD